ncbi:MAG: hypothetical protein V4736_06835, partial [Bdellovibrionota bacterium]
MIGASLGLARSYRTRANVIVGNVERFGLHGETKKNPQSLQLRVYCELGFFVLSLTFMPGRPESVE